MSNSEPTELVVAPASAPEPGPEVTSRRGPELGPASAPVPRGAVLPAAARLGLVLLAGGGAWVVDAACVGLSLNSMPMWVGAVVAAVAAPCATGAAWRGEGRSGLARTGMGALAAGAGGWLVSIVGAVIVAPQLLTAALMRPVNTPGLALLLILVTAIGAWQFQGPHGADDPFAVRERPQRLVRKPTRVRTSGDGLRIERQRAKESVKAARAAASSRRRQRAKVNL